jgi:DNA repair ATPase RecN
MKFLAAALGSFLLFVALPSHAQSPDAGSQPPSTAKPVDPTVSTPAAASADKKKPKKVWTDDNIGSAKGNVSVVGDANSSSQNSAEKRPAASGAAGEARQNQIQHYRDQIQQYRDQIDAIDKRIDQLKNFKAENTSPSGGINMNQGYNMVPVEDQVKQLEDKKKQLQSKIDDTEVEARKNGIDPGDLR